MGCKESDTTEQLHFTSLIYIFVFRSGRETKDNKNKSNVNTSNSNQERKIITTKPTHDYSVMEKWQ